MRYYGIINPVGTLSDNQAMPNATNEPSDAMVFVGGPHNGTLWINVYSDDGVTYGASATGSIELEAFSADTTGSATAPFSITNASGLIQGSGTTSDNAHTYLMHHTAADSALAFSAGDLICEFGIPETMLKLVGFDWVQLRYANSENFATKEISAFVYIK